MACDTRRPPGAALLVTTVTRFFLSWKVSRTVPRGPKSSTVRGFVILGVDAEIFLKDADGLEALAALPHRTFSNDGSTRRLGHPASICFS